MLRTTAELFEIRAERVIPAPLGVQITRSVFVGELFGNDCVTLKVAIFPRNLTDLILPAIGWSLGIAITGADAGEFPWSLAEIAVTEYSNPVSKPLIEQFPVTLFLVGAEKQVKVST